MATTPIDLSAGLVPKQSGGIDLSAGLVPNSGASQAPPTSDPLAKLLGQQKQTDLERWLQPTQHDASQGVMGNVGTALSNIGAAGLNALTHPEQMVTGAVMSSPPVQAFTDIRNAVRRLQGQGQPDEATQHPIQNALQTAESAIGTAGALAAPEVATEGALNAVQGAKNYLRPPTSPAVVSPTEMAARKLASAVLPSNKDASDFIQAAQQEVPNVIDYAKRTGNPLNTQLEFSKAAQGYAQEVRGLYQDQILGPVKGQVVKTTGTGFGERTGEGPDTYATLGDIDQRVINLNKQLDAPALNSDDARRALASKTDLQAEARGLTQILHQNLATSSGLEPPEVADLRQRVGRSYELANDTNAAVTARMQAVGRSELGPVGVTQLPSRALEFVRGGPVPIADRNFQRAIAGFPGQANPLPSVTPSVTPPASLSTPEVDKLLSVARLRQQAIRDFKNAAQSQGSGPQ